MRQAIREIPGFEVVPDVALGTFSFAKYLMWKDLVGRADLLKQSPVVRHLVDRDGDAIRIGDAFPKPATLDATVDARRAARHRQIPNYCQHDRIIWRSVAGCCSWPRRWLRSTWSSEGWLTRDWANIALNCTPRTRPRSRFSSSWTTPGPRGSTRPSQHRCRPPSLRCPAVWHPPASATARERIEKAMEEAS